MKPTYIKIYATAILFVFMLPACEKDLNPYDSKSDNVALATPEDLQTATYGVYARLITNTYSTINTAMFGLSEYQGDNIAANVPQASAFSYSVRYTHYPGMAATTNFWNDSYKLIYSANRIIERIKDGESPVLDQIKGENLFLRAMAHFNLMRFFARPYPQGEGNLGIVLKDNTKLDFPARSTVKEVYDFMISDLLKSAELMTVNKNACFASKEVAFALLSRIYLYKEDNENAIIYANKVLESSRYHLLDTDQYKTYFTFVPENNPETIFAFRNNIVNNSKGTLGGMYYNDPITQTTGFGQIGASLAYAELLDKYPEDARHSFIQRQLEPDGSQLEQNGVPVIYVLKYNFQEGETNLSSPVYLRLAEMYLNRAEANAKLGNLQQALDDVNIIRTRAGIPDAGLYTLDDLKDHTSVLEVVLEERRLELAFEGHRSFDLFRNNLPMIRAYPGFHGTNNFDHEVQPNDPRIIYFIPENETNVNPNLDQNP